MFDLSIISPKRVLFDDVASRVFLDGKETEFELLSFHVHVIGILRKGKIIIDGKKGILIKKGVVKFYENKCVILVEEPDPEELSTF